MTIKPPSPSPVARRARLFAHVAFVALAAPLGIAVTAACSQDARTESPDAARPAPGAYADGRYSAVGEYGGQPSHITVDLTLDDGVITTVAVTPHAYVPRSLELQRAFAEAVPAVVVGRPIDEVRVGKLAGSSSTPDGFNDALDQIRAQARR